MASFLDEAFLSWLFCYLQSRESRQNQPSTLCSSPLSPLLQPHLVAHQSAPGRLVYHTWIVHPASFFPPPSLPTCLSGLWAQGASLSNASASYLKSTVFWLFCCPGLIFPTAPLTCLTWPVLHPPPPWFFCWCIVSLFILLGSVTSL